MRPILTPRARVARAPALGVVFSVALAFLFTSASAGAADCAAGDRVSRTEADCLAAGVTGAAPVYGPWTWTATNHCADLGPLTIATDDGAGTVVTKATLGDGMTQTTTWTETAMLADVYCCVDLSDACNRSDITAERCLERFATSGAASRCTQVTATVDAMQSCTFAAECTSQGGSGPGRATELKIHWSGVSGVSVCDTGELWEGVCP